MSPQARSKRSPARRATAPRTSRAKRPDEKQPSLRYTDSHPSFHRYLIHSMSDEAKALLFTIYVLGCLLLALSLVSIFLMPERLPQTRPSIMQEQQALREQTTIMIRGTPVEVPAL